MSFLCGDLPVFARFTTHDDNNKNLDALFAQYSGNMDYAAHVNQTVSLGQERHGLQEALAATRETRTATVKGGVEALEPHNLKQTLARCRASTWPC